MDVKIPTVGESITSGVISTWHKKDGEPVQAGDILLTLETDKVATEIPAEKPGILHIKAREGQEVKIGEVVATIDEAGAAAPPAPVLAPSAPPAPVEPPPPAPAAKKKPAKPAPPPVETPTPAPTTPPEPIQAAPEPAPSAEPVSTDSRSTRKPLSPLRRKIATQLVMAQHNAAILTTVNECDMTAVMTLRKQMQDSFQKQHGVKLGFMSFFVKAVIAALKAVPQVNSRLEGDDLITNHYYDIGVAVGTERGLVVPVIRDADHKSFAEIEQSILDYAGRAREGKIKIDDLQGGVFTISNGGVYGSLLSTPILNPPQSGILGLHKIQDRPMAIDGQVVIRPMMYLALSYDHRVVDGKEAVTFLIQVKESIENPVRLLLEV
ncbi:MAG: dihydrolipoyllysine-residue succinyltransferase [Chthoniobacteraceae bacterium]|jgi:2-oxoglutarate dehydrogenase E2 component (dihydrolipoamide succinyltransferase)